VEALEEAVLVRVRYAGEEADEVARHAAEETLLLLRPLPALKPLAEEPPAARYALRGKSGKGWV
jgi:hypothetical protein